MNPIPLTFAVLVLFAPQLAGQWHYEAIKDEMTDKVSWHIYTFATPFQDPPTTLNWWCDSSGLDVYVRMDEYLSGDTVDVQYRFDAEPASPPQRWEWSKPLVTAPRAAVPAISTRARTAAKVLIRVIGSDGDSFTYTFDLDGSIRAAQDAQMRNVWRDSRGRLSRVDSLILETGRTRDTLTFAAAYDRLPCAKPETQRLERKPE